MTIEMSAQAPASPIRRLEGMRVCADVIALSQCMAERVLSSFAPFWESNR